MRHFGTSFRTLTSKVMAFKGEGPWKGGGAFLRALFTAYTHTHTHVTRSTFAAGVQLHTHFAGRGESSPVSNHKGISQLSIRVPGA